MKLLVNLQIYNHKAIIVHTVHTLTMDFKDSIKQLSQKAAQFKDNLLTEEATKTTLVLPFIMALGYDVFNPLEVVPEMDCALVNKKSDKIDYAIMIAAAVLTLLLGLKGRIGRVWGAVMIVCFVVYNCYLVTNQIV